MGGFDEDKSLSKLKDLKSYENRLSNSISRSRSMIFDYALCNDFDYFVTLTLDKSKLDRYNLQEYIKKLGQFIRDRRKIYNSNIQYLLIPEQHKDGAWHMHGMIKGIPKKYLTLNSNNYLTWYDYEKRFGYISLGIIRDKLACSKYITKYVSKELGNGIDKEKKLYYVSRGLKKPVKIKEGILSANLINSIQWQFENDYIKVKVLTDKEYTCFNL